ncbi:ABC transporter substrate-binding protein [uncultured Eubacterium sp.]|uniref:ABC transporter substrate-binding protein n=1 Tax=uncultured Eubacterium sp. TaxID=165185 RepID=UPI0025E689DA|nr:ABC transporter substrate-binding protein [uncultured Eubacterium sp.]
MKKFLAVLLAALMICISFVACSSEKKSDDTNTDANTQETLTMATNAEFPPYEYKEGDKVVGIDAEVAQAIADKLGMKLEIVDTKFDAIIPGVQSGKYDMGMAGMTVTPEREQSVAFSDSYATGIQSIIVKQGSAIKSVDDLSEKTKIGVQLGTTGDIYAKDDFGDEAVQEYDKGADAVQALLAGKIDCVIIDNEPAKSFVAANEGLEILKTSYAEEDYAICFKKDNTELQKKVNDALKELIADGTLQKIVNKYITAD